MDQKQKSGTVEIPLSSQVLKNQLFVAVFADGFYGATFKRLFAEFRFLFIFRLLKYVGITTFVIPVKVIRSYLAAGVAVNAGVVHVKFTRCIVLVF